MSIEYLNECISLEKPIKEGKFRHSSVYYVKSLLQDQFKPRKFTLEEIEGLMDEVFNFNKKLWIEKGDKLIPHWYKNKWFSKK